MQHLANTSDFSEKRARVIVAQIAQAKGNLQLRFQLALRTERDVHVIEVGGRCVPL